MINSFTKISFIFFFCFMNSLAQNNDSLNYRIFPSSTTQTEPVISISPVNPYFMFASAVTINPNNLFKSEGVYVTTNGGTTWFGSDTCYGQSIFNHGGDPGVVIDSSGILVLTHIGAISYGLFSHYSTDLGASWSNAATITNQQPEDKGKITIDNSLTSSYYNRIYAVWVSIASPSPLKVSSSSNSGVSWTSPLTISTPPANNFYSGGSVVTDNSGIVFVCWAGIESTPPSTEDSCGFAYSTDGGDSWQVTQRIFYMHGIGGTLPQKSNIRVNGIPQITIDKSNSPRHGWLYIVTNEKNMSPAGSDPDIVFRRSTDGGVTWSAGIRVNQDPINDGKIQYFPAMCVDEGGGINIIFYDDRNTTSDSAEVFFARSTNGGDSWTERAISDHRFKPKPIVGGASNYQGDHIDITSNGSTLYALWMDDYSGIYQVWMKKIELNINDVNENKPLVNRFELFQNYPNPFNPTTKISWQSAVGSWQSLKVYDMLGREVATLVDEFKPAGKYEVEFDGSKLTSGIYFYKLQSGNFSSVKKMICIK